MVELLIAMSLMAIMLTTVSLVSVQGTLKKNNDQKRKADLEKVRSALELYRANNPSRTYYSTSGYAGGLALALQPYLANLPTDPKQGTYTYVYTAVGSPVTGYQLCAYMEVPSNASGSCSSGACGAQGCNYAVTQP